MARTRWAVRALAVLAVLAAAATTVNAQIPTKAKCTCCHLSPGRCPLLVLQIGTGPSRRLSIAFLLCGGETRRPVQLRRLLPGERCHAGQDHAVASRRELDRPQVRRYVQADYNDQYGALAGGPGSGLARARRTHTHTHAHHPYPRPACYTHTRARRSRYILTCTVSGRLGCITESPQTTPWRA